MKKSDKRNNISKNIISGALLLGGLAVGFLGANIVAQASEATAINNQNKTRNASTTDSLNTSKDIASITVPLSNIETEEDLIELVATNGTQVILDEETGKMYLAYVNENNYIEIIEISEEELGSLIQQVASISDKTEEVTSEESVGIPVEYWRNNTNEQSKKNRKKLDSEEGRKAIQEAREYKKSQK